MASNEVATALPAQHDHARSDAITERALKVIPGAVNTARRRMDPAVSIKSARGAHMEDVDGNTYIDYQCGGGCVLLGHSYPSVIERVKATIDDQVLIANGTTELETAVAEKVVEHIPCAEQAVACSTGSEASFHALRLARAVTGRPKVVKFQGHYHGFHDYVLMNWLSPPELVGRRDPMSAGMLDEAVDATIVCRFNDISDVRDAFEREGEKIAAVILEPIAHNVAGLIPTDGFLEDLRQVCDEYGTVLIFDEVVTGFRHHIGGFQAISGVMPDLCLCGKALANGFPIAMVAGRRELMERFSTHPDGDVYFAGTFNGNSVSMAAALATLETLETEPVYEHIYRLGDRMREGLEQISQELGVPTVVTGYGSLFMTFFMEGEIRSYDDAVRNDFDFYLAYREQLLRRGMFVVPRVSGRNHLGYSHTDDDVDRTLEISRDALKNVLEDRGLPRAMPGPAV
jgi:glutamate-1-semialdehyde 2,1-aminomutase